MLNITMIAVGSLKEKYFTAACGEYIKRLGAFCRLNMIEVREYRLSQNPTPSEIERGVAAECAEILKKLPQKAHVIPMCIEGQRLSSPGLAEKLHKISGGGSHIAFIIGGSHGLDDAVKSRAAFRLSMSEMTFPHQLARVMLLEQLYRAFSILNGMKYHK